MSNDGFGVTNLLGASCASLPAAEVDSIFFGKGSSCNRAVKICNSCPVVEECLADVLAWEIDGDRYGTFGGMSAAERQREFGGTGRIRKDMCRNKLHEMTDDNIYVMDSTVVGAERGHRRCIACRLANQRKHTRLNGKGVTESVDVPWDELEPSEKDLNLARSA